MDKDGITNGIGEGSSERHGNVLSSEGFPSEEDCSNEYSIEDYNSEDYNNDDHSSDNHNSKDYSSDDHKAALGKEEKAGPQVTLKIDDKLSASLKKMVSRLCSVCGSFFQGCTKQELPDHEFNGHPNNKGTGFQVYHPSLVSLERSVNAGCPLCQDMCQSLERLFDAKPELRLKGGDSLSIRCGLSYQKWIPENSVADGLIVTFILGGRKGRHLEKEGWIKITRIEFHPVESLGLGPEFRDPDLKTTAASSARSICLARSWYQDCLGHESCRNWQRPPDFLPTRLIRIQWHGHDASSNLTINLIETKELQRNTKWPYVTLSHRWGDSKIPKLQKGNMDAFRQEIPLQQLPSLFRDAFYVAGQLGITHIWIDCLCIIQDSKPDWVHESMRMGDYYQFAECNLAATGYYDSSQGLFGEREALSLLHYPVPFDVVLVRPSGEVHYKGIYTKAGMHEFANTILDGPLNCRAWVAQERALSSGIIHFTPKQMWWECNERITNEAFPNTKMGWMASNIGPGAMRSVNAESERKSIYNSWLDFTGHYAGTQLTVETDRFPAAAGIASVYAALLGDNLIAGLWEQNIVNSLLWAPNGEMAQEVPSVELAPSWSWASFPLEVCHISPEDDDPEVQTISGVVVRVLSDTPEFESDLKLPVLERSGVRGLSIRGPLRTAPRDLSSLSKGAEYVTKVRIDQDWDDFDVFEGQNLSDEQKWRWQVPTHILPLVTQQWDTIVVVHGLLLHQAPVKNDSNTFRRLGRVTLEVRVGICDEVLGLCEANGKYEPSFVFEECGFQDLILI